MSYCKRLFLSLAVWLLACPYLVAGAQQAPDGVEQHIDSLLSRMTLEEKLGQLTQYAADLPGTVGVRDSLVRAGVVGSFLNALGADVTHGLQRIAVEESRLGIPLLFAYDTIHGYRTLFPVPLAEASSFDPAAAERSARIAAVESAAAGLHWTFAPMVDVARDPRWGRIVEGAGEDPYLGSVMAAARVRGFQGDDLSLPGTILACAKHFAGYGAAEGGRDYNTVDVSERTLRAVYFPPFRAAVAAGVATFMSAFNEIGGVPSTASSFLMTEVLRETWGFDGLVVSDWESVAELIPHGVAASRGAAGVLALQAGVDIDMVSGIYSRDVPASVRSGQLAEATIDQAVRRVLRAKHALGLFDDPFRYGSAAQEASVLLSAEHVAAAREVARKSIVLLKNEGGVLPLSKSLGSLAVIGPLADDRASMLGSWRGQGQAEDVVTLLEGIRAAVAPETQVQYAPGASVTGEDQSGFDAAVRLAEASDAVVLVLGELGDMSGEARSRASIALPGAQQALAQAIHATGTPVVVVLMNGRPLAIPWLAEHVPALVEAWYLGVQAGPAVADVLFGDYNPGGKLPVTFPYATGQVPIPYDHKHTGRPPSETNPYSAKYIDAPFTPLFPFGHGLSYTRFAYSDLRISPPTPAATDTVTLRFALENAGQSTGDEVVQLYVRDPVASTTQPVRSLKGFYRVSLAPGERKTVTFRLPATLLALYDAGMRYVVEPGRIEVFVGSSSEDIRLTGSFDVSGPVTEVSEAELPFTQVRVE